MRIGIFGGSFDPVHFGHLLLAEWCREQCVLDRICFVPAAQSPHKADDAPLAGTARREMLRLAVAENPAFEVSDVELQRGGMSYTVDTLEALHQQQPGDDFFLLMGADSLHDLPNWREPERICELAMPIVARRPGSPPPDFTVLTGITPPERIALAESLQLTMPQVDISSSEIRARVSAGRSIRYQTPPAVIDYIAAHGLYRR